MWWVWNDAGFLQVQKHTFSRDHLQLCFLWVNLLLILSERVKLNSAGHTHSHTQSVRPLTTPHFCVTDWHAALKDLP